MEITADDKLMQMYEVKIPVVKRLDNGKEIYWPFTLDKLELFLHQ